MTFSRSLLVSLLLVVATTAVFATPPLSVGIERIPVGGLNVFISGNTYMMSGIFFAVTAATNPAPPAASPTARAAGPAPKPTAETTASPLPARAAPASTPAETTSTPAGLTLDGYIKILTTQLTLSDSEKQEIESYYVADGEKLKSILNDDTLSPMQQARQVSDLRDARNAKIESLLDTLDRQHEFSQIEPQYRVALTLLAANGGLVSAPAAPAPSTPAPTPASPGNPPPPAASAPTPAAAKT